MSKLRDNLKADKAQLKGSIASDSVYIDNLIFCIKVLSKEIKGSKETFFGDTYDTPITDHTSFQEMDNLAYLEMNTAA